MRFTTGPVGRLVARPARTADRRLARNAARNAAHSMAAREAQRLDDARTLRDIARLSDTPVESVQQV